MIITNDKFVSFNIKIIRLDSGYLCNILIKNNNSYIYIDHINQLFDCNFQSKICFFKKKYQVE